MCFRSESEVICELKTTKLCEKYSIPVSHFLRNFRCAERVACGDPLPCPANTRGLRRPAIVVPFLAVPFSWRTAVRPARARTRTYESISAALSRCRSLQQTIYVAANDHMGLLLAKSVPWGCP